MPVDACILLVRWLCKGAEGWTNVESTVAHRTKRGTFFLSHWRECMPKMQSINQSTWRIGQRVSQGTLGPKLPMRWHSSREIYPSQLLVNWVLSPSSFCKVESKLKSSGGGMGDVSGINTKRYHWNFVFARGKWGRPKYLAQAQRNVSPTNSLAPKPRRQCCTAIHLGHRRLFALSIGGIWRQNISQEGASRKWCAPQLFYGAKTHAIPFPKSPHQYIDAGKIFWAP